MSDGRVLVIEDEVDLAELVAFNLQQAGHHVEAAHNASDGIRMAQRHCPDVVVLDLMLPDSSGIEVCRRLRAMEETRQVGVLMVTARGDEIDRIVGFEIGADDYMVKPFSPRELVLRVGALMRRTKTRADEPPSGAASSDEVLRFGPLSIDVARHRVLAADVEVSLTALEFKLLLDMAERCGRVQTRDALLERVWGYTPGVSTRTVDTHVKRLREKLGAAAEVVETVRGVGYRMREQAR